MKTDPRSQAEVNAVLRAIAPKLYRETSAADLEVVARPIAGMKYAIDQQVLHYRTRQLGLIESCTKFDDGRLKYVVAYTDGQRRYEWESDLKPARGAQ